MLRRVVTLIVTSLVLALSHICFAQINVTVTAPVVSYALTQAFGDLLHIKVLLKGYVNPHYVPVTLSMINKVKKSQIYVPLWHFPLEYRLASYAKFHNIIVPTIEQYFKNGLKFLKYPGTTLNNTHGWWLYPENMLALVKAVAKILIENNPEYTDMIELKLKQFSKDIQHLEKTLSYIGREIRTLQSRYRIFLVCACPAFQYLLKSLNVSCIVLHEVSMTEAVSKILKMRGVPIIMLAEFQKGTKLDYYMRNLALRKRGIVLYLPVLGLDNENVTYTEYIMYLVGKLYGAMTSVSFSYHAQSSSANVNYIYVLYVLASITCILLVITVSALRRISSRLS